MLATETVKHIRREVFPIVVDDAVRDAGSIDDAIDEVYGSQSIQLLDVLSFDPLLEPAGEFQLPRTRPPSSS